MASSRSLGRIVHIPWIHLVDNKPHKWEKLSERGKEKGGANIWGGDDGAVAILPLKGIFL